MEFALAPSAPRRRAARTILPLLLLALGCGGGAARNDPCSEDGNCHRNEDGEPVCDDGFTWEAPEDGDNLTCVRDRGHGGRGGHSGAAGQGAGGDVGGSGGDPAGMTGGSGGAGGAGGSAGQPGGGGAPGGSGAGQGPEIIMFSANVGAITEGESVRLSLIATDPDGIDDVIGGAIVDPTSGATYGTLATSSAEGAYQLELSWHDLDRARTIEFVTQQSRELEAQIYDAAAHRATARLTLQLTCPRGGACGGRCKDFQTDSSHCGSCTNACGGNAFCDQGSCRCTGCTPGTTRSCTDFGFPLGQAVCRADCTGWDTSACRSSQCGNGTVEPGETCETGQTSPCAEGSGSMPCKRDCSGWVDITCVAYLDLATGLAWSREVYEDVTYAEASLRCQNRPGGRWWLPQVRELLMLPTCSLDACGVGPSCVESSCRDSEACRCSCGGAQSCPYPGGLAGEGDFWTGTLIPDLSNGVWMVSFGSSGASLWNTSQQARMSARCNTQIQDSERP